MPAELLLLPLSLAATVSFLAWLFVLLHPARPWDFQPVGDDAPQIPNPQSPIPNHDWPRVCVLVPARNEAESLPHTLPALLTQDYPGPHEIILIDDRSTDNTAAVARRVAADAGQSARLRVIAGTPLPAGWVGKVWALQQGIQNSKFRIHNDGSAQGAEDATGQEPGAKSQEPLSTQDSALRTFVLLTDADILHAPSSLRRLVAESAAAGLGLNSRLARLRCDSFAERLLIPAFVFFFNLLYPMRRVNDPRDKTAAAAGGCVLLSREALERIGGGFECLRGELIDDVNLARRVKSTGLPMRLSLSRKEVLSLRAYPRLADVWRMVSRSAFTELRYSWLRLAVALLGLGLLFVLPVLAICGGLTGLAAGSSAAAALTGLWAVLKGLLALAVMRGVYGPAVRFFELPRRYAWSLPVAGVLYGLMTLASALRHARGAEVRWRG